MRDILICALVAGAPASALAQPDPEDTDGYGATVDVGAQIGGEPIASVDVFYDQLAPYGAWVDDPDLGRVFTPDQPDFVPYTNGHWVYTDVGFVWESSEPFSWATSHYGRWAYSQYYDRWVWLPDTTWGPAWVEWSQAGDDVGWAPLPPDVEVSAGYEPPIEVWHYAPVGHVLDADVSRYYEPRERVARIHREARPIERYARVGDARVIAGPPPQVLRQHRIDVRSARIDAHAVGRWTPAETRAAEQHARDHRADVDAQNRQRIERDAKLRSRAQPAQPAPQRPAPSNVTRTPAPEPAPPAPPQRSHVRTQEPRRAAPVPPTPAPAQPATPPQPPTPPRPAPREMHRPTPTPPTTTHPPQREPQPPRPAPPQPPRVQPQPPRPAPPAPRAEPREMHQPPPQAQPQPHAPPPQAQPHAPPPPKAAPPSEPRRRDDDHRR